MRISIEIDKHEFFAEIIGPDTTRYTLEMSGAWWILRTDDRHPFAEPLKRWRTSGNRAQIRNVLPDALAFILAS